MALQMPSDGLGYKSLAYGRVLIMDQIRSDCVSPHQADQMFNPQWMGSILCKHALTKRKGCHTLNVFAG